MCFRLFFGRYWSHHKGISKLTDLYKSWCFKLLRLSTLTIEMKIKLNLIGQIICENTGSYFSELVFWFGDKNIKFTKPLKILERFFLFFFCGGRGKNCFLGLAGLLKECPSATPSFSLFEFTQFKRWYLSRRMQHMIQCTKFGEKSSQ